MSFDSWVFSPTKKIDRALLFARNRLQVLGKPGRERLGDQVRRELVLVALRVPERKLVGVRLEEKVEGIQHRHFGYQIHLRYAALRVFSGKTSRAR